MGNKKNKKDAALNGLTKAERKALEQQEAALIAELEARAAKPVKPKGKTKPSRDLTELKRKALKTLAADRTNGKLRKAAKAELKRRAGEGYEPSVADQHIAEKHELKAEAAKPVKPKREPKVELPDDDAVDAANAAEAEKKDRVRFLLAIVADLENNSQDTRDKARAELTKLASATATMDVSTDETNEQIKARVKAKRAARDELAALEATADDVDRADAEAVTAYNARVAELGGGRLITSDDERAKEAARLAGDEEQIKPRKAKADELVVTFEDGTAVAAPEQIVTEVETETGREFKAGPAAAPADADFGKPSEAPQPLTLEEGRNGYKIMLLKPDGTPDPKTVRQFTRVTTYIDNLEDKTNLERWKMRTLLEGVALSDTPDERGRVDEPVVAKVREHIHVRDMALAKAAKADRKGKLEVGERFTIEVSAVKAFKDALNVMASDLLELGGVHEKANRGTNLHALAELYDVEGIDPIDAKLAAGDITPTDHASIVAYGEAMAAAGIKVVASEVVIVNDAVKYAGRFDRIVLARRPGDQRASRVIADIKSGRLDYGLAKVEQQVAMYADGQAYDLETGERTPLGAVKSWGLVIHLPQGEGTCTIHVLDLTRGRKANGLSAQVRAHRSEAGRMKLGPDLAKPETASTESATESEAGA